MTDLTARLVLSGDSTGIVGAANDGSAALDRLKTSAAGAGAAGAGMAPGFNAATVAIAGQTAASNAATNALTASGAAKVEEVTRLTQLASASSTTTARVVALSAAHSQYNSTVNQARTLLAAGVLDQAAYGAAVDAASVKLALSKIVHDGNTESIARESGGSAALTAAQKELGEGAEDAAVHFGHMGLAAERLGAATGIGMVNMRVMVEGIRGLAAAAETPIGGFVLTAVAIAAVVAVAQLYESSVNNLLIATQKQNNALHLTDQGYLDLAAHIASVADVSQREGRTIAEDFVNAGAQSSEAINSAAQAMQGYAVMTGKSADEAAQDIAKMFTDPAAAATDLTTTYGLFNTAQLQLIKNLQDGGNAAAAQQIVMDAVKDHVHQFAGETTALADAWDHVKSAISDAISFVGGHVAEIANAAAAVTGFGADKSSAQYQVQNSGLSQAQQMSAADAAALNKEELAVRSLDAQYDNHRTTIERINDDERKLSIALADGAISETQYAHDYAGAEKEREAALKALQGPVEKLDEADRAHLATINHLIEAAPETIALAKDHADALEREAQASNGTALSIKALQEQYDVTKVLQPYITAQTQLTDLYDRGKVKLADYTAKLAALKDEAAQVTAQTIAEQRAQDALQAKQEVRSGFEGLSSFYSSQSAATQGINASADYIEQKSAEIRDMQIADARAVAEFQIKSYQGSEDGFEAYGAAVQDVLNNKIAKAYQDDLARQTTWTAGVTRGLTALNKSTEDWAATSESLVKGFSTEFENDLATMIATGQSTLQQFFQWIIEQLVKLAYQKYLANDFNALFGDIVGGIGNIMGLGAGGSTLDAGTTVAGVGHSGMMVGQSAPAMRDVPMAIFANAQRFHWGGLAGDEVPIIARKGERILNVEQTQAYDSGLSRPIVLQMPANANGAAPPITVNIQNNHPNAKVSAGQPRRGPDGTFALDVLVDEIDARMATKSRKGRSLMTNSLEATHGIKRGGQV